MKLDPKTAFETASGWRNHYHYRHGQHHLGGYLHESKEAADQWRAQYFDGCRENHQWYFLVTYFDLLTCKARFQERPTEADRKNPNKAFYDDCTSHYATFEAA